MMNGMPFGAQFAVGSSVERIERGARGRGTRRQRQVVAPEHGRVRRIGPDAKEPEIVRVRRDSAANVAADRHLGPTRLHGSAEQNLLSARQHHVREPEDVVGVPAAVAGNFDAVADRDELSREPEAAHRAHGVRLDIPDTLDAVGSGAAHLEAHVRIDPRDFGDHAFGFDDGTVAVVDERRRVVRRRGRRERGHSRDYRQHPHRSIPFAANAGAAAGAATHAMNARAAAASLAREPTAASKVM